jgi:type I restriction enzyme S subunit
VGQVIYIEEDYWPLNTTLWVTNFKGNEPRFIAFFLKHLNLARFTGGVSVPTLNRNILHNIEVRLPPLAEQRSISQVLQAAQMAVDIRQRELKIHRELLEAMLDSLLTGLPIP